MKTCKHCGALIAKGAKVCPKCGGKNKPPIYQRPWFIILVAIIVLGCIGSAGKKDTGNSSISKTADEETNNTTENKDETASAEENIEYMPVSVSEMVKDIEGNAMKAQEKYRGNYFEITGELGNIDSDGKYIGLNPEDETITLVSVQCFIKSDEQKSKIMELSKGDKITIRGKCKDVGEILGYSIDIDSID
ncbi:MAG: hypothetical protein K5668_08940 [Lachnospiraceae bacterium]|nr:hypothetical protein [Lachnospiraceae bacterium]